MRHTVCWLALLLAGCSTTTTIHSNPPGAKVWLDGIYQGQTPLTLTLPDGSDNGYKHVRLELDGYEPTETAIGRRQDSGRLICGYFCLLPMLWVYKYESSYQIDLRRPGEDAKTPKGGFAPPPPASGPSSL